MDRSIWGRDRARPTKTFRMAFSVRVSYRHVGRLTAAGTGDCMPEAWARSEQSATIDAALALIVKLSREPCTPNLTEEI